MHGYVAIHVLRKVWGLKRYYDLLYANGSFMSAETCAELASAVQTSLVSYKYLALNDRGHRAFWSIRPKFHMWQHLAETFCTVTKCNPRLFQCYRNESFMGLVRRLVHSGHRKTLASRCLERYIVLVMASRWSPLGLQRDLGVL